MQPGIEDFEKLKELEESLWIAETRFDLDYMESILLPGFFEFGRSGKIYTRDEILSASYSIINAKLPLKNFKVNIVTEAVALVTYISEVQYGELETGNRSSLWLKTSDGWKLQFHQGTPVIV